MNEAYGVLCHLILHSPILGFIFIIEPTGSLLVIFKHTEKQYRKEFTNLDSLLYLKPSSFQYIINKSKLP